MKNVLIGTGALFLAAVLFFLTWKGFFSDEERSRAGEIHPAPPFILQDYDGKSISLSDFSGSPVVIHSWATWCPFCANELFRLAEAQKEFQGRVVVIAVNRAESLAAAKKYSDDVGATPNLLFLLDPEDSFYRAIGGFAMPETLFIDRDGFIRDRRRGSMEKEEMRRRIERLLENNFSFPE